MLITDHFAIAQQDLPDFATQFLDVPLEQRRQAWEWFSQHPERADGNPCVRTLSGRDYRATVCCPWGAILVALNLDEARRLKRLRPTATDIGELLDDLSDGAVTLTKDHDAIDQFTHLADNGLMTEEQVHRLMVPEDYPGGA